MAAQDNRHEEEYSYDQLFPIVGSRSTSPCALSLGAFFSIFCSRLTHVINHCSNYLQDITTCNSKDVKPSSFSLVWLSYPNWLTGLIVHARRSCGFITDRVITKNGVGWDYLKIRNVTQLYSCPVLLEKSARHGISSAVAELMNKSILWGTCPIQLKNAKVIPVRKTIMIYL